MLSKPELPVFSTSCCLSPIVFTQDQVACYLALKQRCAQMFNDEDESHAELLDRLHYRVYGRSSKTGMKWVDMGFQSNTPATDFRDGGVVSLECLLYLTSKFGKQTLEMVDPASEFLMAAASINCTFFLKQYFHLGRGDSRELCSQKEFKRFVMLLTQEKQAFEHLSSLLLIRLFEKHWLPNLREQKHTIMDFNKSLKQATREFVRIFSSEKFGTLGEFSYLYGRQ